MQRFEAYEDRNDKWRWRLFAANGRIIASSGEAFSSKTSALRAAEGVRQTAPNSVIAIAPGLGDKAAMRLRALLIATATGSEVTGGLQRRAKRSVKVRRAGAMDAPFSNLTTMRRA